MSEATLPPTETHKNCPLCGSALDPAKPAECPKCDWVVGYRRQQEQTQHATSGRDMASMLMSVVPGLGHIYKGHKIVGAILMACTLLVAFFVAATATSTVLFSVLLLPIYWGGVMLHAYWAEDLALKRLTPP